MVVPKISIEEEKRRLMKAWERFSAAVRARLCQQVERGHKGWDVGFPDTSMRSAIFEDAKRMVETGLDDKAIDIAAWSMFLYNRAYQPQPERADQ